MNRICEELLLLHIERNTLDAYLKHLETKNGS